MKNISSLSQLQSKEKASSPSYIGVESIQVSTENDHLSNFVSKLTPEELSKITKEEWIEMVKSKKQKYGKTGKIYLET